MNAEMNMKIAEIKKGMNTAVIVEIMATIPKTKVELTIIVPIWSPILISLCFNLEADIPKTSSGSVVAIESKKSPTTIWGNLKSIARAEAYLTTKFEDKNKQINFNIISFGDSLETT